ncbi:MAG: hypothetical protein FJ098_09260 [Deltaproteobacteria bacterium]|nr:hypothetical protein [Deltaproteobacteria bacterium]
MHARDGWILLLLGTMIVACGPAGGLQVPGPPGLDSMLRAEASAITREFPGYAGSVYALGKDEAHWFGVLTRTGTGDGPEHLLVGIGPRRTWSEALTLEAGDREVTAVEVPAAWLGDLQKDGVPDLVLHLRVTSKQQESGRTQVRDSVRVYGLGQDLHLAWVRTVGLVGSLEEGCRRLTYDHRATPSWTGDAMGGVHAIRVHARTTLETCAPVARDCSGPVICGMDSTEEVHQYVWDADLSGFRAEDAKEVRFTIPDVDFH